MIIAISVAIVIMLAALAALAWIGAVIGRMR